MAAAGRGGPPTFEARRIEGVNREYGFPQNGHARSYLTLSGTMLADWFEVDLCFDSEGSTVTYVLTTEPNAKANKALPFEYRSPVEMRAWRASDMPEADLPAALDKFAVAILSCYPVDPLLSTLVAIRFGDVVSSEVCAARDRMVGAGSRSWNAKSLQPAVGRLNGELPRCFSALMGDAAL